MITKRFGKIGIAIGITILFCGLSLTPCIGDPLVDYDLPEYRAIIFSPFSDTIPWAGDDELFNRVLISGGWKEENIINLIDEDASHENLIESLQYLESVDDCYDTTLICLFTHGDPAGFLDYDLNDVYYYSEFDSLLDQLHSAGIGVIVDGCFSGAAIQFLSHEGRVIATSTDAYNPGVGGFGKAMALGFDGFGDFCPDYGNNNGVTSIEEAFDWIIYNDPFQTSMCLIDDRYPGQLHITFQNWETGRKDQITSYTFISEGNKIVQKYGDDDFQVAQSFQPQNNYLTKVKIHLSKNIYVTASIIVSIRSSLNGIDLTSIELDPSEIESFELYTTFDFPDIFVMPGSTYFIVCRATQEINPSGWYTILCWNYGGGCYPNGQMSWSNGGNNWHNESTVDVEFVTYGRTTFQGSPPYVPKRPAGPVLVFTGDTYSYNISTEDVNNDNVFYLLDWDDQQQVGQWLGPYSSGAVVRCSHRWSQSGIYHIRVKAKDIIGMQSDWSDILTVTATYPPETPIISGKNFGIAGRSLQYTFCSTDPDNENVYYQIDWGDFCTVWQGPYPSGQQIIQSHTWINPGNYVIKCKAKDINGAESDWGLFNVKIV